MPIEYRTGDLFEYKGSLAHGVNAAGAMGKGIAIEFKKRFPTMYTEYREKCKTGQFLIGSVYPYYQLRMRDLRKHTQDIVFEGVDGKRISIVGDGETWTYRKIWVYNLCIKAHWSLPADDVALWASLRAMVKHMEDNDIDEVAMPRIGAGLGQLDWETCVQPIIEEVGNSTDCTLIVYSQ